MKPWYFMIFIPAVLFLGWVVAPHTGSLAHNIVSVVRNTDSHDYISELRVVAKQKGLYWSVRCTKDTFPDEPSEAFAGEASYWPMGSPEVRGIFIEDGAKPEWWAMGATQQEAARKLLNRLQDEPNIRPDHKPEHRKINGAQCPPELTGTPAGDEIDKRCPGCKN